MQYTSTFSSPLGDILLAADADGLTGLWFEGAKYYARGLEPEHKASSLPVFEQVKDWLALYFSGQAPDFTPPLHLIGSPFQLAVWSILRDIPYGQTVTYREIAKMIARQKGRPHMSAQAVGGAVGRNPVSILVPCHRVVGADGSLTGYAGGVEKKRRLLALEGLHTESLPTKLEGRINEPWGKD